MSNFTRRQGIEAGNQAVESYGEQIAQIDARLGSVSEGRLALKTQYAETCRELAVSLLPDGEEATVGSAATALGTPSLVETRAERFAARDADERRLSSIEGDKEFQEREQLLGPEGQLTRALSGANERLAEATKALDEFQGDTDVTWLRENPQPDGLIAGGIEYLSGTKGQREEKSQAVQDRYGSGELGALQEYEDGLSALVTNAEAIQQEAQANVDRVQALVTEHEELQIELDSFDTGLLTVLREAAAGIIDGVEPAELQTRLEEDARLMTGKLAAITGKLNVLQQMETSMRTDRDAIVEKQHGISRVVGKWRRSSKSSLGKDHTKWLVTGPSRSSTRISGRYDSFDLMYASVLGFDDYLMYSMLLGSGSPIIPYMVFSELADMAAPERFAHEVLPEFHAAHEEHGEAAHEAFANFASGEEEIEAVALDSVVDDSSGQAGDAEAEEGDAADDSYMNTDES